MDRKDLEQKLISEDKSVSDNGKVENDADKRQDTGKSEGVNDIGQKICQLEKSSSKELTSDYDIALLRVFYWAAFYGHNDTIIDYMILYKRWSPYLKSFKKQSVLTAAIRGKRITLVRLMSNYQFVKKPKESNITLDDIVPITNMFNKDVSGLNPLHYAYLYDLPNVRQILRQSGLSNDVSD